MDLDSSDYVIFAITIIDYLLTYLVLTEIDKVEIVNWAKMPLTELLNLSLHDILLPIALTFLVIILFAVVIILTCLSLLILTLEVRR